MIVTDFRRSVKVDGDLPLDKAVLVGCGAFATAEEAQGAIAEMTRGQMADSAILTVDLRPGGRRLTGAGSSGPSRTAASAAPRPARWAGRA